MIAFEPGDEYAGLRIEREIGRGAYGRVYLAEDPTIGRHPLAMLIWASNGTTILRARQITHFHLSHLYVVDRGAEERPGRHLFWAT